MKEVCPKICLTEQARCVKGGFSEDPYIPDAWKEVLYGYVSLFICDPFFGCDVFERLLAENEPYDSSKVNMRSFFCKEVIKVKEIIKLINLSNKKNVDVIW